MAIKKGFLPATMIVALKNPEDVHHMGRALLEGMSAVFPKLHYNTYICYLYMMLAETNFKGLKKNFIEPLAPVSQWRLNMLIFTMYSLKFKVVKNFYNCLLKIQFWMAKNLPYLFFYKFEKPHTQVTR